MMVPDYQVLLSDITMAKIVAYRKSLLASFRPGKALEQSLRGNLSEEQSEQEFLSHLLNTKRPRIFAESEVLGDGSDWTLEELGILGDISIAVPVTVNDNGLHANPLVFQPPFQATLIYAVGALLQNSRNHTPADWEELTTDGKIDLEGHYRLFERRLLPVFKYVNQDAKEKGRQAFLTLTAMGCGHFAGPFRGQLGEVLKNTLIRILKTHHEGLSNLKAVYYDPYRECQNERHQIGGLSFLVRPLTQGNEDKPQLCPPDHYQEADDDFSDCDLYSIVAWDHVSWPGNDFYVGSRATDDGVKAAATDSMWVMTGVEGEYDPQVNKYQPPAPYQTWEEVVLKNDLRLSIADNLLLY